MNNFIEAGFCPQCNGNIPAELAVKEFFNCPSCNTLLSLKNTHRNNEGKKTYGVPYCPYKVDDRRMDSTETREHLAPL